MQDIDTIIVQTATDTLAILIPRSQAGPLAHAGQIVGILVGLGGLLLAVVSALWAGRQWRLQHVTKEWAKTVQFLLDHPTFLDEQRNAQYEQEFKETLGQYEMVARVSIGYVDDLYHLGFKESLHGWLKGSVKLFVGRHRKWFDDHPENYSAEFRQEINDILK